MTEDDVQRVARADIAAEFRRLHNAARGCEFDLSPADGPIARLTLFVHENGERIIAALAAIPSVESAVMAEREACAKVADEHAARWGDSRPDIGALYKIGENIRARPEASASPATGAKS